MPNPFLDKLKNPDFMSALAQILTSTMGGRYGGYAGQAIGTEREKQRERARTGRLDEEAKLSGQSERTARQRQLDLLKEQIDLQNKTFRSGQLDKVLQTSLEQGIPPSQVAGSMNVALEAPEAASLDASFKSMQSGRVKIDPSTGATVSPDTMGPFQQAPVSLPPAQALQIGQQIQSNRNQQEQFNRREQGEDRRFDLTRSDQQAQAKQQQQNWDYTNKATTVVDVPKGMGLPIAGIKVPPGQEAEAYFKIAELAQRNRSLSNEDKRLLQERFRTSISPEGTMSIVDIDKVLEGKGQEAVKQVNIPADIFTTTNKRYNEGMKAVASIHGIDTSDPDEVNEAMANPVIREDARRAAVWMDKGMAPVIIKDERTMKSWRGPASLVADPDDPNVDPGKPLVKTPENSKPRAPRAATDQEIDAALDMFGGDPDKASKYLKDKGLQVD